MPTPGAIQEQNWSETEEQKQKRLEREQKMRELLEQLSDARVGATY